MRHRCANHGRRFCIFCVIQTAGFLPEHLFWTRILGVHL